MSDRIPPAAAELRRRLQHRPLAIVADQNIPFVAEAFASLGRVTTVAGRSLTREALTSADVLLVRSVTRVDDALLEGTAVQFVGTATIGTDHIDEPALARRHVAFASAAGSNANSVAEYVLTAIYASVMGLLPGGPVPWPKRVGVVGVGHIGRLLIPRLAALGHDVFACDPPLADALPSGGKSHTEGDCSSSAVPVLSLLTAPLMDIDRLLHSVDAVTLHVPLTTGGPYPTHHLLDADRLADFGGMLINTSRGSVINLARDASGVWRLPQPLHLLLDVWEHEPNIDWGYLSVECPHRLHLASPHIAGYSFDGKVAGTRQLHDALCDLCDVPRNWTGRPHLGESHEQPLSVEWPQPDGSQSLSAADCFAVLARVMTAACDVVGDTARMHAAAALPPAERAAAFDELRRTYPRRREFTHYQLCLPQHLRDTRLIAQLQALGFDLDLE